VEPQDPHLHSIDGEPSPSPQQVTGLVIAVVLLLGFLASAIAWKIADLDAAERAQNTADAVVSTVDQAVQDHVLLTGGADAVLGSDGSVTQESLDELATSRADARSSRPVAWIVPTDGTDGTGGWEVRLSAESQSGTGGTPVEGGPLRAGVPVPPGSDLEKALDLAARTGHPVVTRVDVGGGAARLVALDPVLRSATSAPSTVPGSTIGPDATTDVLGVVASLDPPGLLASTIESDNPGDVRYRVSDGDSVLAESTPPPDGGVVRRSTVGDTSLFVEVEDARPVNHDVSWFIMWVTAIVIVAAGIVGLRSVHYDRERRLTTAMISGMATLAHHLARAATADEVATVIGTHAPRVFGARLASFGALDADSGVVRLHHGTGLDPDLARQFDEVPLETVPGLVAAVSSGSTVLMRSPKELHEELPGSAADTILSAGARSAAVLPLAAPDRGVVAIVGILWWDPRPFDARTTGMLETVRELCEQSLERAALTDRISVRASHLAGLSERLAGVGDVAGAARTAASMAFDAVGAQASCVAVVEHDDARLLVHRGEVDGAGGEPTHVSRDAATALARVARSGIPALFHDAAAAESRYPAGRSGEPTTHRGARAVFPLRADDAVVGAMDFSWDGSRTFTDDLVHELTTVTEITAQAVRRAQLIEDQAADARRSEALSQLAQGLSGRADTDGIAEFLANALIAPFEARHAIVGFMDGPTFVRRYSRSLLDLDLSDIVVDDGRWGLAQRTPATDAFRGDHLVFVGTPEEARSRFPELCTVWTRIGVRSCAAVPIRSGTGSVIATMTVMWDRPMVLRDELRDMLGTVGGMVGQTLERTGLVDELRTNAERFESLADFAQHLAGVRTTEELVRSVTDMAAPAIGAAATTFGMLDGQELRRTTNGLGADLLPHPPGKSPSTDAIGHRPSPSRHPAYQCLQRAQTIELPDERAIMSNYPPDVVQALDVAGIRSTASVPVFDGDGRGIGVLAAGWTSVQRELPGTIRSKLRTLAELCAQTYQRVSLGEAEHRVVVNLQDRVVRPVPEVAGLSIAQRYLPASSQVGIGGDWYEGIPIGKDRVAVVVGDIAGHGIGAVVDMVELRAVVGSHLRGGTPLGEVYPRVTDLLRQVGGGLTATSCIAVFDTSNDTVCYVSAGHPPPVLARPDGTVELLERGRLPLLGVSTEPVTPGTAPFPPGSLLTLYTDGIVERRREPIDVSLARLEEAVRDLVHRPSTSSSVAGVDVEGLADELLHRCLGQGPTDDDVALVVIARR